MFLNDIKYDWIGDISDDWEIKRIKNLFYLKKEVSDNPEEEEILSLTMGGIIKRDISSNEGQLPETYKGYTKIYPDDMVMNPMDLKSGWVDKSKYDGIISPSYYVLNKLYDDLDIGFFNYQLQRHYKERIFFSFGQGISYDYRWGLGRETILNFPIIVPPLKIQTQIVSFLDTKTQKIDELIEKTEQKIKLLKEKRTSLINHCVTKGLNPDVEMKDSGVEWIENFPESWMRLKIKHIGNLKSGNGFPEKLQGREIGDIPFFKVSDTNNYGNEVFLNRSNNYVSYEECENNKWYLFQPDTIVFPKIGMVLLKNKRRILKYKSLIDNNMMGFTCNEKIDYKYGYYLFTQINFKYYCSDGTVPSIGGNQIGSLDVVIPPKDEQTQIVEYLDEQTQKIDSTIEKETQRIELLKEYRQSLISEVVTGKIDVRDWKK